MPNIGPMEIALVLIVALIILGPKKLPDMGRSMGKGMREFKAAITGDDDSDKVGGRLAAATAPAAPTVARAADEPAEHRAA
jgi:sec-independent protein translocase protein TatA